MDSLQIQHAISQIEIYSEQLKEHILGGTIERIDDLEYQLKEAESEISKSEDNYEELESEVEDLKEAASDAKQILEGLLGKDDSMDEDLQKAIDLL